MNSVANATCLPGHLQVAVAKTFSSEALSKHVTERVLHPPLHIPAKAGVSKEHYPAYRHRSIKGIERVSSVSFASGLRRLVDCRHSPSRFDPVFFGIVRFAPEACISYGWPELFSGDSELELDDETLLILTVFVELCLALSQPRRCLATSRARCRSGSQAPSSRTLTKWGLYTSLAK